MSPCSQMSVQPSQVSGCYQLLPCAPKGSLMTLVSPTQHDASHFVLMDQSPVLYDLKLFVVRDVCPLHDEKTKSWILEGSRLAYL